MPSIGTKELVAAMPLLMGLSEQSHIVGPLTAYPTYAVSAGVLGARFTPTDDIESVPDADFIWLNSPSNPTGRVLDPERLRAIVSWGRERGIPVVSDECYIELGWDVEPRSILHPSIVGTDHTGVVALHSLSKRSNLAGYRFGFAAGDRAVITTITGIRKHLGMMVPAPVQAAAIAALDDDAHAVEQKARYRARREILRGALLSAGFTIDHSEAGLYLWATRHEDCWDTVAWGAERGVLVTPGAFYGESGREHVRVALTATDERVGAFAERVAAA